LVEAFEKMRGVVLGRGFLGERISRELWFNWPEIDVLEIRKLERYLDDVKPEVVVNCVGKTGRPNIDWCEDHKEETMLSNVSAAVSVASTCSKKNIYFAHIGSGCVYQGENRGRGYTEDDVPNNLSNIYVRSKIISENVLKELPGLHLRIRMPLDDRPHERNFIDKVLKYPKVIDEQNSITTVPHLIGGLGELIERRVEGVYNFVNPGTISAAEVMEMYKERIDPTHNFEVISSEELDGMTKAKRSNCFLNTEKLESLGICLPEIHEAVRECMIKYGEYFGKWSV